MKVKNGFKEIQNILNPDGLFLRIHSEPNRQIALKWVNKFFSHRTRLCILLRNSLFQNEPPYD
jgi:hypothetical protein